jgi:hypothetical protein
LLATRIFNYKTIIMNNNKLTYEILSILIIVIILSLSVINQINLAFSITVFSLILLLFNKWSKVFYYLLNFVSFLGVISSIYLLLNINNEIINIFYLIYFGSMIILLNFNGFLKRKRDF